MTVPPPESARPLVVTDDPDLLDELVRLAAAAGVELDVAQDAAGARRRWAQAPCVVVAAAAATGCVRARLPRRPGVVLLGDDLDDAGVWQAAVELGAEHVRHLPEDEAWLLTRFGDAAEGPAAEGPLLAVVGGRGGAGATVLAAAIAVTAVRLGRSALLVDGDPFGGGIDLVLGGESERGLRWPELAATRGRVPAGALAQALPRVGGLAVLSCDRDAAPVEVHPEAMSAVLAAGRRAHDLVVVDLPRRLDDLARVVLADADVLLVVVPAEVRGAAAAARVATAFAPYVRDLRVVVRGPAPAGLDGPAVAEALGLPLAGELRPEPGLALSLERGQAPAARGRGPLAELSLLLVSELLGATAGAA